MATDEANEQHQPDRTPPSEERQRELEAQYSAQKEQTPDTPYKDVKIRTMGELVWVMTQRHWLGNLNLLEGYARPNLSGAVLVQANLSGMELSGANLSEALLSYANLNGADLSGGDLSGAFLFDVNLSGADLGNANLSGAILKNANLSGAILFDANLRGTSFEGANLSKSSLDYANLNGAILWKANLSDISLVGANLGGASLESVNLSGANLQEVFFDEKTDLSDVRFDQHTKLGDVQWNGALLLRIDWSPLLVRQELRLGDEDTLTELVEEKEKAPRKPNRQEMHARLAVVNRSYIGLAREFKDQNLTDLASATRLRSKRLNRRAMFLKRTPGSFIDGLGSWLLDVVSGYGEIPQRTFVAYLIVVSVFASMYWGLTNFAPIGSQHLVWYEALILSVSSFHGRGFFTSTIQLGDPLAAIGAIEAIIGLFIELILIATFSRRFLGD